MDAEPRALDAIGGSHVAVHFVFDSLDHLESGKEDALDEERAPNNETSPGGQDGSKSDHLHLVEDDASLSAIASVFAWRMDGVKWEKISQVRLRPIGDSSRGLSWLRMTKGEKGRAAAVGSCAAVEKRHSGCGKRTADAAVCVDKAKAPGQFDLGAPNAILARLHHWKRSLRSNDV